MRFYKAAAVQDEVELDLTWRVSLHNLLLLVVTAFSVEKTVIPMVCPSGAEGSHPVRGWKIFL